MKIAFDDNVRIDRGSWRRLMGVSDEHLKRAESDEKMRAALERLETQMDEAESLLFDAVEPAFAYRVLDAEQLTVRGTSLARHLDGCDRLVVMAVTLGHAVDRLISETQASRIALGVVIDSGASVMAPDLRAGAALVIAALSAEGVSTVGEIRYILRGYENFAEKLRALGGNIALAHGEKDAQKIILKSV